MRDRDNSPAWLAKKEEADWLMAASRACQESAVRLTVPLIHFLALSSYNANTLFIRDHWYAHYFGDWHEKLRLCFEKADLAALGIAAAYEDAPSPEVSFSLSVAGSVYQPGPSYDRFLALHRGALDAVCLSTMHNQVAAWLSARIMFELKDKPFERTIAAIKESAWYSGPAGCCVLGEVYDTVLAVGELLLERCKDGNQTGLHSLLCEMEQLKSGVYLTSLRAQPEFGL